MSKLPPLVKDEFLNDRGYWCNTTRQVQKCTDFLKREGYNLSEWANSPDSKSKVKGWVRAYKDKEVVYVALRRYPIWVGGVRRMWQEVGNWFWWLASCVGLGNSDKNEGGM